MLDKHNDETNASSNLLFFPMIKFLELRNHDARE